MDPEIERIRDRQHELSNTLGATVTRMAVLEATIVPSLERIEKSTEKTEAHLERQNGRIGKAEERLTALEKPPALQQSAAALALTPKQTAAGAGGIAGIVMIIEALHQYGPSILKAFSGQ